MTKRNRAGSGTNSAVWDFFVQDSGEPKLAIPDVQSAIFRAIPEQNEKKIGNLETLIQVK